MSRSDRHAVQADEVSQSMKVSPRLLMVIAAPLMLVNLGLFVIAWFVMGSALILAADAFPSLWPMTIAAAISAALYTVGLFFIAVDTLEDGARGLRRPRRLLTCSLFGLAMNSAGALLGLVVLIATLFFAGAALF
jgi:hypothetical protein